MEVLGHESTKPQLVISKFKALMKFANYRRKWKMANYQAVFTVISITIAICLAFITRLRNETYTERELTYILFPGQLYLRAMTCLTIPLIFCSMVATIAAMDLHVFRSMGIRSFIYYFLTTVFAVTIGICLALAIQPGSPNKITEDPDNPIRTYPSFPKVVTEDVVMDIFRNMFPDNFYKAQLVQQKTSYANPYSSEESSEESSFADPSTVNHRYTWKTKLEDVPGSNMFGILTISVLLGIGIRLMGEKGSLLLYLFRELEGLVMIITSWVLRVTPFAIFFLMLGKLLQFGSFTYACQQFGLYFLTIMVGLFIHGFIILPVIYAIFLKALPFKFYVNLTQPLFMAFGTSSSLLTYPVTCQCLEENSQVDSRITRSILPIGSMINLDGTALYTAVTVMFIAQQQQITMGFGTILIICIIVILGSMGSAGIPNAGMVTMKLAMSASGLRDIDFTLFAAVDGLLGSFRTTMNVLANGVSICIIQHLSQARLSKAAHQDPEEPQK